jgi:tetrahydromethanopterin S-methyltransferase subunit G
MSNDINITKEMVEASEKTTVALFERLDRIEEAVNFLKNDLREIKIKLHKK